MSIIATSPATEHRSDDKKRWTQDDCRKLEALEMLEAGRYELIEGEIYLKVGQDVPHARANGRVFLAMTLTFGADYAIMPVSLSVDPENSPEPDVMVTRHPTQNLMGRKLQPSDARLIVEVSASTLSRDRNVKRFMYAGAGVPEYWVLDINGERLFVYRNPQNGDYASPIEYGKNDSVSPLAAPQATIAVADLLP